MSFHFEYGNMRDCNYSRDSINTIYEDLKDLLIENSKFAASSNPKHLDPNDLLLRDDSHEETHLYTASQNGELQPLASSFMVPGIYKRICTTTSATGGPAVRSTENVFLSEKEPHGRIITAEEFKKLYVCVSGGNATRLPRRVVLLRKKEKLVSADTTSACIEPDFKALTRLAHNILKYSGQDHIVIDRKRNEIVRTENGTNQQTIYRVIAPETLALKPPASQRPLNAQPIKLKLGRPRKPNVPQVAAAPPTADKPEQLTPASMPQMRTRFGRTVKFVKPSLAAGLARAENLNAVPIRTLLNDLRDSDYHCNQVDRMATVKSVEQSHTATEVEANTRRFPPEAHCPTCNKIFLGRRMQRHFLKHPEHAKRTTQTPTQGMPPEEMSLFRFLVAKLQRPHMNEDQRADLFLHEINDFVEQLQLRSSRLIRNASGLHLVNGRTARMLGIPEGHYAFDMHAMQEEEAQPSQSIESDTHGVCGSLSSSVVHTRHLDYTQLSMSMDDTITDETAQKLNLSAGGKLLPPSEETLLRVVGDLVHDGIKKMDAAGMMMPSKSLHKMGDTLVVPHYDQASDNAVEALSMKETPTQGNHPKAVTSSSSSQPILDLAVDFFKFANNK